jgi:hypothetical protein
MGGFVLFAGGCLDGLLLGEQLLELGVALLDKRSRLGLGFAGLGGYL